MPSSRIRIGIVGSRGHVGLVFNTLATRDRDQWELTALCESPGVTTLQTQAGTLGLRPEVFDDAGRMVAEAPMDLLVVADGNEDHAAMTLAGLQRNLAVFCEKPVAATHEQLQSLEEVLASDPRRIVVPMLPLRFDPAFAAAHALVRKGAIGAVRLLDARKSYRLGTRDASFCHRATSTGTIPWVGSHAIDLLRWFAGVDFLAVTARHSTLGNGGYGDLEASAALLFEMERDILATATLDYLRPDQAPTHGDDRLRIAGTQGVIEVRHGQCRLINPEAEGERLCAPQAGPSLFGALLDALLGAGPLPISRNEMLTVNRACLLARDAADRKTTLHL